MARQITKGAFVYADPDTFGPIGAALAAAGADMTAFNSTNAARLRAIINFLRQGCIFANLATGTGSVTAEAQSQTGFVRPLVATGGTLAAALGAFTAAYTEAEFDAAQVLVNQIRTCLLNAGIGTTTAAITPYTNKRLTQWVPKDYNIGGTAPAAASAQSALYVQADVQTIIDVAEWCRSTVIQANLASDAVQVDAISVLDNGGSTEQFALNADVNNAASMVAVDYDVPAAGLVDRNGTVVSGFTTAAFTTDASVATVTKDDATNFHITPVGKGRCSVYFGVAGQPRLREVVVTITDDNVPATLALVAADAALSLATDSTEQLTWTALNAGGFVIDEYTDDNTYVTFESAEPTNASVDAAGLVTGLIVNASVIVTATFARTFTKLPFGAADRTVTLTDTVDFSVSA